MKTAKHNVLFALYLLAITAVHAFASPGAWDQTFAPTITGGSVYAMAVQTDGKLLIGGGFTAVNASVSRSHLARLYSDGSLDTTFFNTGSGVYSTIWSITVQSDGRIIIGGDFTSVNGTLRTRVARLNVNGTVDGSFIPTNAINGNAVKEFNVGWAKVHSLARPPDSYFRLNAASFRPVVARLWGRSDSCVWE